MIRKLTAKSSLDSLRREAKRWLKAVRESEPEALARLKQSLPRAGATPGVREIQQALAREYGAVSWAALKLQLIDAALARALHAAAWTDSLPVARLLVERGAAVACDRKFNATPLGWASYLGSNNSSIT